MLTIGKNGPACCFFFIRLYLKNVYLFLYLGCVQKWELVFNPRRRNCFPIARNFLSELMSLLSIEINKKK